MSEIGILGGGQLGRMLLQAAIDLPLTLHIMDPDAGAPCSLITPFFSQGSLQDFDTVYRFGQGVEVLSIEIETVNTDALAALEQEGKKVYPQPSVIHTIQDKIRQKRFYERQGLPSVPGIIPDNFAQATEIFRQIKTGELPGDYVAKLAQGGYDGRGVFDTEDPDLPALLEEQPIYFEQKAPIVKELAVIAAKNARGQIRCFPPVEMVFHPQYKLVDYLLAPAQIPPELARQAEELAAETAKAFDIVGLLAVEMFWTHNGQLLINEVAPRPHNSGHHTMKANRCSQFEQHLRTLLNFPLAPTGTIQQAAMVNILGEEGFTGTARYEGLAKIMALEGVSVHLYGKKTTKPGRKMGHVIILDDNLQGISQKVQYVKTNLKVIS